MGLGHIQWLPLAIYIGIILPETGGLLFGYLFVLLMGKISQKNRLYFPKAQNISLKTQIIIKLHHVSLIFCEIFGIDLLNNQIDFLPELFRI